METLLTREEFKKKVFERTNGKCCVPGCQCEAVDAHHILDRKLWSDNGYYLSNGAALCSEHHLDAERGVITPIACMNYMRIDVNRDVRIPDALKEKYLTKEEYVSDLTSGKLDKWGNIVEEKPTDYDPDWYKKFK